MKVTHGAVTGSGHGIRVLIADDSAEILAATAELLDELEGAHVVARACTVEEAVRAAALHVADLAFVDATLAGGGAETFIRQVNAYAPGLKVVAMLSYDEPEKANRLAGMGALATCVKQRLPLELPAIVGLMPPAAA